jgi:hypothetical protein
MKEGIAGKIAGGFLQSKLSLLLMVAFAWLGRIAYTLFPEKKNLR